MVIVLSLSAHAFAEESPFYYACKNENLLKDRPATGLFRFKVPNSDPHRNVTTLDLLLKLKQKINLRIEESENLIENILFCNKQDAPSVDCKELLNWVDIEIPKYVREARYHLAVAQSPHQVSSWKMKANLDVNVELTSWALYKEAPWQSLTDEEKRVALNVINNYQLAILTSFQKKLEANELKAEDWKDYSNDTMLYLRNDHFLKYKSMLGALHLMQHLSTPDPKREDVITAILTMRTKLGQERTYVNSIYADFPASPGEKISKTVLPLFNYSSLLEEILLDDENYCALASSIVFYQMNREIRKALIIGLPIMVACFFVPPAAAIVAGAAASAIFLYMSQKELNDETLRNLGHIYGDEAGIAIDKMSELKRSRDFDLVLLPTSFISFGYLASKASTVFKASITQFLNNRGFSTSLMRHIRISTYKIRKFSRYRM